MLVQFNGTKGHPIAVDADDVHAAETLVEAVYRPQDGLPSERPCGTRIHCNRHGVTAYFDVTEDVAAVVGEINISRALRRTYEWATGFPVNIPRYLPDAGTVAKKPARTADQLS